MIFNTCVTTVPRTALVSWRWLSILITRSSTGNRNVIVLCNPETDENEIISYVCNVCECVVTVL